MKAERKQAARERLAVGAQLLVNPAPALRREESARAVRPLANAKERRVFGDGFEDVDRRTGWSAVALAKPSPGSRFPVRLGLAGRDRDRGAATAPPALRAREALLRSKQQHGSADSLL